MVRTYSDTVERCERFHETDPVGCFMSGGHAGPAIALGHGPTGIYALAGSQRGALGRKPIIGGSQLYSNRSAHC